MLGMPTFVSYPYWPAQGRTTRSGVCKPRTHSLLSMEGPGLKPRLQAPGSFLCPLMLLLRPQNKEHGDSSGRKADWLVRTPGQCWAAPASASRHRWAFLAGASRHSAFEGRRLATCWTLEAGNQIQP